MSNTFIIESKDESVRWPVKLMKPKNGGTYEEITVFMKLLRVKEDRWDELAEQEEETGDDMLAVLVCGWDDDTFKTPDGTPLNYSEENKEIILNERMVRTGITAVYQNWFTAGLPSVEQAKKPRKRGRRK